jgi:hypothetical protein
LLKDTHLAASSRSPEFLRSYIIDDVAKLATAAIRTDLDTVRKRWFDGLVAASGLSQLGLTLQARDFATFVVTACMTATRVKYYGAPGARCCELISLCVSAMSDAFVPVDGFYAHFSDGAEDVASMKHGHLHPHVFLTCELNGHLHYADLASAQFDACSLNRERTALRPVRFGLLDRPLARDFGYSVIPVLFCANVSDEDLK